MRRSVLGMMAVIAALALAGCGHRHHAYAKAHHGCDGKQPSQQPAAQQPAGQQPSQIIVVVPPSAPAAQPAAPGGE